MTATVTSEVTVYGAVGAVFLFLLVALLLGLSFSNPCKFNDDGKYLGNSNFAYDRDQVSDASYSSRFTMTYKWCQKETHSGQRESIVRKATLYIVLYNPLSERYVHIYIASPKSYKS